MGNFGSWLRDLWRTVVVYLAVGAAVIPLALVYGALRAGPPEGSAVAASLPWAALAHEHPLALLVVMTVLGLVVAALVWGQLGRFLERPRLRLVPQPPVAAAAAASVLIPAPTTRGHVPALTMTVILALNIGKVRFPVLTDATAANTSAPSQTIALPVAA